MRYWYCSSVKNLRNFRKKKKVVDEWENYGIIIDSAKNTQSVVLKHNLQLEGGKV